MLPEIGHGLPFVAATTILTGPAAGTADTDTNAADKTASAADNDTSTANEAVEPGRDAGRSIRGHRVPRGRHNVDVSESVEHDGR
jgi:hypothetical protein